MSLTPYMIRTKNHKQSAGEIKNKPIQSHFKHLKPQDFKNEQTNPIF